LINELSKSLAGNTPGLITIILFWSMPISTARLFVYSELATI